MNYYSANFEPTVHFRRWLDETAAFDIPQLIDEAFEKLENDEMYELDDDNSISLEYELSELLIRELGGMLPKGYAVEDHSIAAEWNYNDGNKYDYLLRPLTNWALLNIDFWSIAESLLQRHGKWSLEHKNSYDLLNFEPAVHFRRWLNETAAFDIPQLIDEAFEKLENDEMFELDDDISLCLQEQLRKLLIRELEGMLPRGYAVEGSSIGAEWNYDDGNKYDYLLRPLANWALFNINFDSFAESLLRRHGKWNPERVRPEEI